MFAELGIMAIFCSAGLCRVIGAVPQIHWRIAPFSFFNSALFRMHRSSLKQLEQISIHSNLGFSLQLLSRAYHEVRLGANVRINALTVWRVFQAAMLCQPRLHATSTAKSISGAMNTPAFHLPLLPACQRRRPVSPGWVPFAQLAVLINHPAQ